MRIAIMMLYAYDFCYCNIESCKNHSKNINFVNSYIFTFYLRKYFAQTNIKYKLTPEWKVHSAF